jgi:hypothetical protein
VPTAESLTGGLRPLDSGAFASRPPDRPADRPLLWLATALDAAIVQAMRLVVNRVLLANGSQAEHLRRSAEPYLSESFLREHRHFLSFQGEVSLPRRQGTHFVRTLRGGAVLAHRIDTDLAPDDPMLIEHWVHEPSAARATVLALHGFTMGWPRIDAIALLAKEWFGFGLDVALLTLPFHGPRTPAHARFSGDSFARPDVGQLNASARRAIQEIILATRWLRSETNRPVGLLGLSLGAYLAATVAGLEPDLAFVVAVVPPVCFGDLAWRFLPAGRAEHPTPALSYDELRLAFRVHSPLAYAPIIGRDRLLVVAGRGDRIVPPEHPSSLWRHWGEPAIHWFQGSHLAPFGRGGIVAAMRAHLAQIGIVS